MIEIVNISEEENLDEAKKKVKAIKAGKIVDKEVEAHKRPKFRSAKQRMALKKARRKSKMAGAKRKRKKSMKRRSRISSGQQRLASRIMKKRRSLRRREGGRKKEALIFYGNDNLFIAEDTFTLRDAYGEDYSIDQGYLFDVYDNGFDTLVDVYNVDGEMEFESVEVLPSKIYNYFKENVVALVDEEELDESYVYLDEDKQLTEMSGPKLSVSDRKMLNKQLYDLTTPLEKKTRKTRYFRHIAEAWSEIIKILAKKNIVLLQEDQTEWSGFFAGASGSANIDIGYKASAKKDPETGLIFYAPIVNAILLFQWYKMQSGNYEINTYLG